ncbi:MAG: hypothetical protein J6V25_04025 [Oscillospiraceae bacterium]|nr:hypothetical protein [Oscillospiraceae bacterium]
MKPHEEAERSEAKWDRFIEDLPECGCCCKSVYPHTRYYELRVKNDRIIVCADCKSDLDMSETILEV